MATMTTEELLDVFKNMTVLELNDFLKAFEDEFGVTAAAPAAVAVAAAVFPRPVTSKGRCSGRYAASARVAATTRKRSAGTASDYGSRRSPAPRLSWTRAGFH